MQRSVILENQLLWNKNYIRMCLSSFFQYLTHYTLIVALPIFVVQTIFFLLILRFFHGAGFATGTMVTVFVPISRIGEGVGYLAVFTSIAMVIGPLSG